MKPERWQQIEQLYHAALDHKVSGRNAFLNQACDGDADLRKEVESLIASHEQAGNFIAESALKVTAKVLAEEQTESLVGTMLSHYRIESLLGVGGMGEVYLAEDTKLGRKVALKLLPITFTRDAEPLRRFEQEARAASALNHPNILTIYEIGQADGHHYAATEFIAGETLREHVRSKRVPIEEALDIAGQIASALAAAHEAGIVHRDIKPENIMVRRDGFVKVLDFGLAKLIPNEVKAADSAATEKVKLNTYPGMVLGTVQYMSPEQAAGQDVDSRTDIWSLGVVLYETICGRTPFVGPTPSHTIVSILEDEAAPLRSDVPEEVEEIVNKALRKNKEERYGTASELARELKSLRQELLVEARLRSTHSQDAGNREIGQSAQQTDLEKSRDAAKGAEIAQAGAISSAEYLITGIKRHKQAAIAAAVMILVITTLAYALYFERGRGNVAPSGEAIDSLAVLPFVNTSGDTNSEHLADGISDSVINSLSGLPNLRVISLNAVLSYKGRQSDPQTVGRALKVRAVLMGRMTERGDDLTIRAELVDVRDNSRLWGEQYDRKRSELLSVQEEIARKISEGLRLRLSVEQKKQLEKRSTQNSEAHFLYSLGRHNQYKNTRKGFETSVEYYEQAIDTDPKYALAYVGLASALQELVYRGLALPKEALRKAEWAALKAVELDETLSEAHNVLAIAKTSHKDWAGVGKEFERALELDPNSLEANWHYARYLQLFGREDALVYGKRAAELDVTGLKPAFLGFLYMRQRQYDDAIEVYLKALKTAPNRAHPHFLLGEVYLAKRMYKEGLAELQKAVALDNTPERWDRQPMLAYAYAVTGKPQEALKILAEQKQLAKQGYIASYNFAIIYTGLGDKDRAFEYLNKAFDEGTDLINLPTRPMFDDLRSDPRYADLLRRMNLEQSVIGVSAP